MAREEELLDYLDDDDDEDEDDEVTGDNSPVEEGSLCCVSSLSSSDDDDDETVAHGALDWYAVLQRTARSRLAELEGGDGELDGDGAAPAAVAVERVPATVLSMVWAHGTVAARLEPAATHDRLDLRLGPGRGGAAWRRRYDDTPALSWSAGAKRVCNALCASLCGPPSRGGGTGADDVEVASAVIVVGSDDAAERALLLVGGGGDGSPMDESTGGLSLVAAVVDAAAAQLAPAPAGHHPLVIGCVGVRENGDVEELVRTDSAELGGMGVGGGDPTDSRRKVLRALRTVNAARLACGEPIHIVWTLEKNTLLPPPAKKKKSRKKKKNTGDDDDDDDDDDAAADEGPPQPPGRAVSVVWLDAPASPLATDEAAEAAKRQVAALEATLRDVWPTAESRKKKSKMLENGAAMAIATTTPRERSLRRLVLGDAATLEAPPVVCVCVSSRKVLGAVHALAWAEAHHKKDAEATASSSADDDAAALRAALAAHAPPSVAQLQAATPPASAVEATEPAKPVKQPPAEAAYTPLDYDEDDDDRLFEEEGADDRNLPAEEELAGIVEDVETVPSAIGSAFSRDEPPVDEASWDPPAAVHKATTRQAAAARGKKNKKKKKKNPVPDEAASTTASSSSSSRRRPPSDDNNNTNNNINSNNNNNIKKAAVSTKKSERQLATESLAEVIAEVRVSRDAERALRELRSALSAAEAERNAAMASARSASEYVAAEAELRRAAEAAEHTSVSRQHELEARLKDALDAESRAVDAVQLAAKSRQAAEAAARAAVEQKSAIEVLVQEKQRQLEHLSARSEASAQTENGPPENALEEDGDREPPVGPRYALFTSGAPAVPPRTARDVAQQRTPLPLRLRQQQQQQQDAVVAAADVEDAVLEAAQAASSTLLHSAVHARAALAAAAQPPSPGKTTSLVPAFEEQQQQQQALALDLEEQRRARDRAAALEAELAATRFENRKLRDETDASVRDFERELERERAAARRAIDLARQRAQHDLETALRDVHGSVSHQADAARRALRELADERDQMVARRDADLALIAAARAEQSALRSELANARSAAERARAAAEDGRRAAADANDALSQSHASAASQHGGSLYSLSPRTTASLGARPAAAAGGGGSPVIGGDGDRLDLIDRALSSQHHDAAPPAGGLFPSAPPHSPDQAFLATSRAASPTASPAVPSHVQSPPPPPQQHLEAMLEQRERELDELRASSRREAAALWLAVSRAEDALAAGLPQPGTAAASSSTAARRTAALPTAGDASWSELDDADGFFTRPRRGSDADSYSEDESSLASELDHLDQKLAKLRRTEHRPPAIVELPNEDAQPRAAPPPPPLAPPLNHHNNSTTNNGLLPLGRSSSTVERVERTNRDILDFLELSSGEHHPTTNGNGGAPSSSSLLSASANAAAQSHQHRKHLAPTVLDPSAVLPARVRPSPARGGRGARSRGRAAEVPYGVNNGAPRGRAAASASPSPPPPPPASGGGLYHRQAASRSDRRPTPVTAAAFPSTLRTSSPGGRASLRAFK